MAILIEVVTTGSVVVYLNTPVTAASTAPDDGWYICAYGLDECIGVGCIRFYMYNHGERISGNPHKNATAVREYIVPYIQYIQYIGSGSWF